MKIQFVPKTLSIILHTYLKVGKFQSSFLPKYEQNIVMISSLYCVQGRIHFGRYYDFINSFWYLLAFRFVKKLTWLLISSPSTHWLKTGFFLFTFVICTFCTRLDIVKYEELHKGQSTNYVISVGSGKVGAPKTIY